MSADKINVVDLYIKVAKGEMTPDEAAGVMNQARARRELVKIGVVLVLAIAWFGFLGVTVYLEPSQPTPEELRQRLGECLSKKQVYSQCTAVDTTHDLCERLRK